MPRATGLFGRAVGQSVPGTFFTPELVRDIAGVCAAELGLKATAADLSAVDAAAEAVSARMHAAWIAFAAGGDPGWPPFASGLVQIFDTEPAVAPYPEVESRRIWLDHTFASLPLG